MQTQTHELRQVVTEHLIMMHNERESLSYDPTLEVEPNNVEAFIEDLMQNKGLNVLSVLQKSINAGAQPAIVSVNDQTRILVLEVFRSCPEERKGLSYKDAVNAADTLEMQLATPEVVRKYLRASNDPAVDCFDYLLASEEELRRGCAPFTARQNGRMDIFCGYSKTHFNRRGWRGMYEF